MGEWVGEVFRENSCPLCKLISFILHCSHLISLLSCKVCPLIWTGYLCMHLCRHSNWFTEQSRLLYNLGKTLYSPLPLVAIMLPSPSWLGGVTSTQCLTDWLSGFWFPEFWLLGFGIPGFGIPREAYGDPREGRGKPRESWGIPREP